MLSAKASAIATVALLAACASAPTDLTSIDYQRAPPADWPNLEIAVSYLVSADEMAQRCPHAYAHLSPGRVIAGCTRLQLCGRRCLVYLAALPPQLLYRTLDHERAHCLGYDHPGSTRVRESWARAKAQGCGPDMPSRSF